jgi:hypothetical protein
MKIREEIVIGGWEEPVLLHPHGKDSLRRPTSEAGDSVEEPGGPGARQILVTNRTYWEVIRILSVIDP